MWRPWSAKRKQRRPHASHQHRSEVDTTVAQGSKSRSGKGPGRPPFCPTKADRDVVGVMAACGIPQERIRLVVLNPATGKPIEIETLQRAFAYELEAGRAQTDLIFATSLISGLRAADNSKMALYARNRLNWDRQGMRVLDMPPAAGDAPEAEDMRMEIVLVKAKPREEDP